MMDDHLQEKACLDAAASLWGNDGGEDPLLDLLEGMSNPDHLVDFKVNVSEGAGSGQPSPNYEQEWKGEREPRASAGKAEDLDLGSLKPAAMLIQQQYGGQSGGGREIGHHGTAAHNNPLSYFSQDSPGPNFFEGLAKEEKKQYNQNNIFDLLPYGSHQNAGSSCAAAANGKGLFPDMPSHDQLAVFTSQLQNERGNAGASANANVNVNDHPMQIKTARVISTPPKDKRVVTFSPYEQIIQLPHHLHDRFVTTLGTQQDASVYLQGEDNPFKANNVRVVRSNKRHVRKFQDIATDATSLQTSLTHIGSRAGVIESLEKIIQKLVLQAKELKEEKEDSASEESLKSSEKGGESSSPKNSSDSSNTTTNAKSEEKAYSNLRYGGHNYKGVTKHRCTGRWEAHIWDQGKQVYLGGFSTSIAAARAYDLVAVKCKKSKLLAANALNFPLEYYTEYVDDIKCATKDELVSALRRKSCGFARGTSKFRGVTRRSQNGRWEARSASIGSRKYTYLGTFDTEAEAAHAYDRAAIRNHGLNAVTNFDISVYSGELSVLLAHKSVHSPTSNTTSSYSEKSCASSSKRKRRKKGKEKEKMLESGKGMAPENAHHIQYTRPRYFGEADIHDFLLRDIPTMKQDHHTSHTNVSHPLEGGQFSSELDQNVLFYI
jgi:hypothetical protein